MFFRLACSLLRPHGRRWLSFTKMPRSCLRGKHVAGEAFEIGSQAGIDPRNPRTYVVEHDVDVVFLDVELYPPEGVVQLVQRLKNDERRRPAADAFVVALQIRRVL